jgi:hypothetical protein
MVELLEVRRAERKTCGKTSRCRLALEEDHIVPTLRQSQRRG